LQQKFLFEDLDCAAPIGFKRTLVTQSCSSSRQLGAELILQSQRRSEILSKTSAPVKRSPIAAARPTRVRAMAARRAREECGCTALGGARTGHVRVHLANGPRSGSQIEAAAGAAQIPGRSRTVVISLEGRRFSNPIK
jgi:hypothetical protein